MFGKHTGIKRSHKRLLGVIALNTIMICGSAQGATDFEIQNESQCNTFVGAMRAAEYVRTDSMFAESHNPRAFGALAGVMTFAQRNPDATYGFDQIGD